MNGLVSAAETPSTRNASGSRGLYQMPPMCQIPGPVSSVGLRVSIVNRVATFTPAGKIVYPYTT